MSDQEIESTRISSDLDTHVKISKFFKTLGIIHLSVIPLLLLNVSFYFFLDIELVDPVRLPFFILELLTSLVLIPIILTSIKLLSFESWNVKTQKARNTIRTVLKVIIGLSALLFIYSITLNIISFANWEFNSSIDRFEVISHVIVRPIFAALILITLFVIFLVGLQREFLVSFLLYGTFLSIYHFLFVDILYTAFTNTLSDWAPQNRVRYSTIFSEVVLNGIFVLILIGLGINWLILSKNFHKKEHFTKRIIFTKPTKLGEDQELYDQDDKQRNWSFRDTKDTHFFIILSIFFIFSFLIVYDEKVTHFIPYFADGNYVGRIIIYFTYLSLMVYLIRIKIKNKNTIRVTRSVVYMCLYFIFEIIYISTTSGNYFFKWEIEPNISIMGWGTLIIFANIFQFFAFLNISLVLRNYNPKYRNPALMVLGFNVIISIVRAIIYMVNNSDLMMISKIGATFVTLQNMLEVICLGIIGLKFVIDVIINRRDSKIDLPSS
ncbi:MAG: hypothetical protein GPJ51_12485 [Candidatus Heimdallarchaeota archaeon]|nr:hypothetical protein [Candidatus Heimdallarchaeota archaeon]